MASFDTHIKNCKHEDGFRYCPSVFENEMWLTSDCYLSEFWLSIGYHFTKPYFMCDEYISFDDEFPKTWIVI